MAVALVAGACGSVPRRSFGVEVTDPSGEPLPDVDVRMSGAGGEFSGVTDEHGSVVFESVVRGSYDVSASRGGFEAVQMSGVQARPAGFLDLQLQPFAQAIPPPPGGDYEVVEVFYGTDRNRRPDRKVGGDPRRVYGGDRGELKLGTLEGSIPKDHRMGELESPRWGRLEFRLDQIAYDIHSDMAPILYSWPSRGQTAAYLADGTNVEWSVPHLRDFLTLVAQRSGASEVHLIAHSMGNRALTQVLRDFSQAGATGEEVPRFEQIVLVAPDIDSEVFRRDIAPGLVPEGKRVTLYASAHDKALEMSQTVHRYPRAGDLSDGVVVVPGVDTIDASAVDTSLTGHSYYADGTSVLTDLFHLLRLGLPPDQREGLESPGEEPERYWRFPPP